MQAIVVQNLRKEFRLSHSIQGIWYQKIRGYFSLRSQKFTAVEGLSFSIQEGERVALIGPNGAGKSTTIKMLTGITYPTEGKIEVLGKVPVRQRKALSYEMSAIFGHSSKLWYHLAVQESYDLLAAIYDIPSSVYRDRLKSLVDRFQIDHLLKKVARQLSLGERMRCEIVASFLHKPKLIFLDEPTIGLDLTAKAMIRDLLHSLSKEEGVTLLLTSHDIDDIEKVCDRVLMMEKGRLLLDGRIEDLKTRYAKKKVIQVIAEESSLTWDQEGIVLLEQLPHRLKIEVDLTKCSVEKVIHTFLNRYTIKDVTIEDPSLESFIHAFYTQQIPV
jgi:ABC-2 type transport system ATP-binding protein